MQEIPPTSELFDACGILFGPDIHISIDFINYLRPEGLKAAYRKRVLDTHPDRAAITGKNTAWMEADFIKVNLAYQMLCSVVLNGGILLQNHSTRIHDHASKREPVTKEKFYTGKLPGRKLRICQFLYYSGIISWNTYIKALVWQKRLRPPLGRIAADQGMLSEADIRVILSRRAINEKFGESAIRLGLLSPYKLMVLLGQQRRFHKPIGEYFIQTGVLSRSQLEMMVRKQTSYNRPYQTEKILKRVIVSGF